MAAKKAKHKHHKPASPPQPAPSAAVTEAEEAPEVIQTPEPEEDDAPEVSQEGPAPRLDRRSVERSVEDTLEQLRAAFQETEQRARELRAELEPPPPNELQKEIERLETANEELQAKHQMVANQLEELREEHDRVSTALDELKASGGEKAAELSAELEQARAQLEELRGEHNRVSTALEELKASGGERAAELTAELEETRGELTSARGRVEELEKELESVRQTLRELQEKYAQVGRSLVEAENANEELEKRLKEADERIVELDGQVAEESGRASDLEAQLEMAQKAALESQKKAEDSTRKAAELKEMLNELEASVLDADERLAAAPKREELEEAEARAKEAEERVAELESSFSEAEQKLRQTEFRLEQIKEIYKETDENAKAAEERAFELEKRAREAERKLRSLEVATGMTPPAEGAASEAAPAAAAPSPDIQKLRERTQAAEREALEAVERAELAEDRLREAEEDARDAQARAAEFEQRISELELASGKMREELEAAREMGSGDTRKKLEDLEARVKIAEQKAREAVDRQFQAEQRMVAAGARTRSAEERIVQLERDLDTSKRKLHEAEERIKTGDTGGDPETERMAFEDRLTNLPNVNILHQYIDYTFKQVSRYKRGASLLCIDLDRFKVINDTLGFKAGDEVLRQVADRLRTVVRDSDVLGRRGDDEFVLLLSELEPGDLPEVRTAEDWVAACQKMATLVSNRVLSALAEPFSVSNQKIHVTASVGASISSDAESSEQFLEHAEIAMMRAKELGRNQLQFYSADLKLSRQRRLSLDAQLRRALEEGEFALHYQPIVHLSSGRMAGAEALLRWKHPEDGKLRLPADFLSVAEETGLIVPIGHWVTMEACRQAVIWRDSGLELFTAINLSHRQLIQADLAKSFARALEVTGLDPKLVVLDIKENADMLDPERTDANLAELAEMGATVAIDDFGVGFSSLRRLAMAQVKMVKFDQSLVQEVPKSKHSTSITTAVLGICVSTGVRSVAEGIETAEQATFFLDKNCELAQGFYFSEPVPADKITEMWEDNRTWSGF